ncbi:MAG TPA: bacteriohemerythrin [Desulfobulbus sp.]|nr:bacteriohemerythrin [Desulfobulbus sp.]HHD64346.1 bacteriohemerythrin [Desulfobulbaceae bacterium]
MANWFESMLAPFRRKKNQEKPDLIIWNETYEIGHDLIDQQHRNLVNIINELDRVVTMEDGTYQEQEGKILQKLINYTVFHFGTEEKLFKNSAYPNSKQHVQIHETMVCEITNFQQKYANRQETISDELLNFLTNWLINHIRGADREYKNYI